MKPCIVIPARYSSSRFPGKPLALIKDQPLIVKVAKLAHKVLPASDVYVATDNNLIAEVCNDNGINFIMTSSSHKTGTDRVAEVASKIEYDYFINLQGDEPTVNPKDIESCINYGDRYPNHVINFYHPIIDCDPALNSIPKVVFNESNELVYISRSLIPGNKINSKNKMNYYRQVCIYGFNRSQLKIFKSRGRSLIEIQEDIEILRFFELSIPIKVFLSRTCGPAVDYPEDVEKVVEYLYKGY